MLTMTDNDIKQGLELIHGSLIALSELREIKANDETKPVELDNFVQLLEGHFAHLHSHIITKLDQFEDNKLEVPTEQGLT